MCSIFGFVSGGKNGPDITLLKEIVLSNISRGTHAHGLAWVDIEGRLHVYKKGASFITNLDILDSVKDAVVMIGHLRHFTHGSASDNANNHPHHGNDGWIVHNGVITDHAKWSKEFNLLTNTACDSEVIGLLAEKMKGPIIDQYRAAIDCFDNTDAFACMMIHTRPARLIVAKRGNPLETFQTDDGMYFASTMSFKEASFFKSNTIEEWEWTKGQGGYLARTRELDPYTPSSYVRSKGWESYCSGAWHNGEYTAWRDRGNRTENANEYLEKLSKKQKKKLRKQVKRGLVFDGDDGDDGDDEDVIGYKETEIASDHAIVGFSESNTEKHNKYYHCNKCQGIKSKLATGKYIPANVKKEIDDAIRGLNPDCPSIVVDDDDDDDGTQWNHIELMTNEQLDELVAGGEG